MKKIFIVLFLFVFFKSNAQYTSIPDTDFELELINQGIDTNPNLDGKVLTSSISSITNLIINYNNLHNLIGIENFTSLQNLFVSNCVNLTTLDLSGNPNLINLECYNNSLNNINISNNVLLGYINCMNNNLMTLNVSNNINLSSIVCMNNNLSVLDVFQNINLIILYCGNNNINSLDVSNNNNLDELFCYNNQITTLNISNKPLLQLISCNNNLLSSLYVSNLPKLVRIHCENNQLTVLNTNNIPTIKNLFCSNNLFTTLDLSNNLQLTSLFCNNNNNLINLNLDNNSLLNILECKNNLNLSNFSIQNGSNTLLNGTFTIPGVIPLTNNNRFQSLNNPNLQCIFVNDVSNCNNNWLGKDVTSNYVTTQQECNNLNVETFEKNTLKIFPNPTSDFLNVSLGHETLKNSKIEIHSIQGVLIYSQHTKTENLKINVEKFSKGIYILSIEKNGALLISKFIVQ